MHGRRVYHARGKVLGGSSSINGMIFQRGNPLDYERWASEAGLETWDYAHCLPYFKKMETCLAGADEWRGGDGPIVLERGPASSPALRRVLRGGAAGRLRADRRRQRLPAGGLRRVRPHDPPRPAAERGARLPAPGDVAARTSRSAAARLRRPRSCSRARARSASSSQAARSCRAGEVILCGGAINSPQLLQLSGRRQRARARAARYRRRPRPARRRREPAGPPRGLRPARGDAAGVGAAGAEEMAAPGDRRALALPAQRARRDEPLRGGRLRPLERRGRLPQPDVPLPAARDPLRRLAAGREARLPGARRADVLRRARLGEDHERRPADASGAALQLPLHPERPARVGRGDPRRPLDPRAAGLRAVRRRRDLARARRSRATTRSSTGWRATPRRRCIPRAPARWEPSSIRRRCASTGSTASASSTPPSSPSSPTGTSTRP